MTHLDLFSGIGGFALAAQWAGFETVAFCEIDPFCQKVLKKHWPGVPIIPDIREVTGDKIAAYTDKDSQSGISFDAQAGQGKLVQGGIGLLTGGFPCQPFSVAGKRRGKEDDRYLWPEMLRVIKECQPRWVLGENVAGIVNMELDQALSDLEAEGYEVWPLVIPACALDALHRRDRVWILAYSDRPRCRELRKFIAGEKKHASTQFGSWWLLEPDVGRVAHGVPSRVGRLRSLGNAIVPQVAYAILKHIKGGR